MTSKGFKSIADILNIDGSDGSFDDDEARKAKERQEERDAAAKLLREKIKDLQNCGDDVEYKKRMLKILGAEGIEVLLHMKHEIEDNPSGRSAECFATVLTSITNTISEMEKIDNNERKNDVDNKKLALTSKNPALVQGSNNVVMVGSTADLLNMMHESGLLKDKNIKEAEVIIEPEKKIEKE